MVKRKFPLSKAYGLLEPGPFVLVTTARKGRANIMTMTAPRRTSASSSLSTSARSSPVKKYQMFLASLTRDGYVSYVTKKEWQIRTRGGCDGRTLTIKAVCGLL